VAITPQKVLRAELMELCPYQPADTKGLIRLNAMENPYSLPASMQSQWLDTLKKVELNRYPDTKMAQLKKAFRNTFAISPRLDLMFGNGSDELIQLLILAVAKPGACILTVTPGFSMYRLISESVGVRVVEVPPVAESFALQLGLICNNIRKYKPALIFLACPNNPTGTLWPQEDVEEIVQQAVGMVIIDEAYVPFASYSMMTLAEKYPHVLMLRTLSKIGLAGLRLGWLSGTRQWLKELDKLRLPYNINALTQVSANFALNNISVFDNQAKLICRQREQLIAAMQDMSGIQVFPSEANFILFRTLNISSDVVFERLIENKIVIKNVADNNLLKNCLRVTVGTEDENQAFLAALNHSLP